METVIIDTILQNKIFFVLLVRGLFKKETDPFTAYQLAMAAFQKYPDVQSIRDELLNTNTSFREAGLGFRNLGKNLVQKVVGTTDENPMPNYQQPNLEIQMDLLFQGIGQLAFDCMWDEPIQCNQDRMRLLQLFNPPIRVWYKSHQWHVDKNQDNEMQRRNEFREYLAQTSLYCEALANQKRNCPDCKST